MRSNSTYMKKALLMIVSCALCTGYSSVYAEEEEEDDLEPTLKVEEANKKDVKEADEKEADTTAKTSNYLGEVILAEDTEGIEKKPVRPTAVFNKNAIIHAIVPADHAPANTSYKASWYVVDVGREATPNSLIDSVEISTDGTRNIDFTLKPATEWPVGTYRVDIAVNGKVETSKTFTVK
jgi:hypothetical protein